MPAYIVVDCDVTNPDKYNRYRQLAPPAIAHHGGRYLVRGGSTAVLEGNWQPKRVVILEFSSLDAAKAFYDSPEYRAAREARAGAADMDIIAVEGA
jgi:uncharacterized protein (DUF1330 family)